jgi:hypothetical protein
MKLMRNFSLNNNMSNSKFIFYGVIIVIGVLIAIICGSLSFVRTLNNLEVETIQK